MDESITVILAVVILTVSVVAIWNSVAAIVCVCVCVESTQQYTYI